MAKYVRSQITDLTENPVWQAFHEQLKSRLETDRLALEDVSLTMDELNMQRGVVTALRQVLYFIKELTENTNLEETKDGQAGAPADCHTPRGRRRGPGGSARSAAGAVAIEHPAAGRARRRTRCATRPAPGTSPRWATGGDAGR